MRDTFRDFQKYLPVVGVILQKCGAEAIKFQFLPPTPWPAADIAWENMRHRVFLWYLSAHPKFFPHPWLIFRKDAKLKNTFQRHVNVFGKDQEFSTVEQWPPPWAPVLHPFPRRPHRPGPNPRWS